MADVRSKNLYELLGNDPELDPNRAPEPPTKAVDRPAQRVGKRDTPKEAPVSQPRTGQNSRRGNVTGSEAAFRDRNAGRNQNREKPTEEGAQASRRGDRGGRPRHDRQSRTGQTDSGKKVTQGWGGQSGEKEWDDERAAEKIAQNDENEPQTPAGEEAQEPVDKSKSYSDYLAEKAAQGDLSAKPVRAANEGTKADSKWAQAKEFKRDSEEDEYIKGKEDKAKREKARKEKNYLDVDMRFVEAPRGTSGPRGRGGRVSRGGDRGGRGARGGRGNGGPRAERSSGAPVTVDEKNFPSLGGK
ncbi:hypothetical protein BBP40_002703 [Aspergillus hancockii]|nr:hypothetical protein BBP40_002703 [Aspergillus hancockii]